MKPPKKTTCKYFSHAKIVTTRICEEPPPNIGTPENFHAAWMAHVATAEWYNDSREQLVVFTLDTRHRANGIFLISVGTVNETLAHPREILRPAIVANAYALVMGHNHPSHDPTPSEADRSLTRRIREAADLFQMQLHDHVIIANPGWDTKQPTFFSFKEHGLL